MMRLCKQEGHVEMCLSVYYNHVKVSSYIALFLILRLVKTFYFHGKPVHQQIPFLHPATMREDCSYTYPPLSVARYSFIQLGELEQCRLKNKVLTPQHRIRTLVHLLESEALPWSHCTLRKSKLTRTTPSPSSSEVNSLTVKCPCVN